MITTEFVLSVWGELACFTRPELKVERFSYPIITPSASRAIFDAIFLERESFRWQVTLIEVLHPPRYLALRRNEVKDKAPSERTIMQWMAGADPEPLWADGDRDLLNNDRKGRTQRQTMALKDVAYRLHARMHPWPSKAIKLPALESQFHRRAAYGKCFYQPYLGCREFPAFFELANDGSPPPCRLDSDLGWMLYDVFDLSRPGGSEDAPAVSLFHAVVNGGMMEVPPYSSDLVVKPEKGGTSC